MVSLKRVLVLSVPAIGIGVGVAVFALTGTITPEAALPDTPTASYDSAAMRAAATAVGQQVQGTSVAQRADLATRVATVATRTAASASQSLAGGDADPAAIPAASPGPAASPVAIPAASPGPAASPVAIPPDPMLPPTFRFYRGINFGGVPQMIEGRPWLGDAQARAQGLSTPNAAPVNDADDPLSPPTDPSTTRMLQSTIYTAGTGPLRITQTAPNGTYAVYVYLVENYQSSYRSLDVTVEGNSVHTNWSAPRGGWNKLGPYLVNVTDGALDVDITATVGDPLVAGLAIFRDEGTATPSPAVG
jgi:hypothetical protein